MILKHDTSSLISKLTSTDVLKYFRASIDCIEQLFVLKQAIADYEEDGDEDEFLSTVEDISFVSDLAVSKYSACCASVTNAINRYLGRTVAKFSILKKNLSLINEYYCAPSEEELQELRVGVQDVLSGLIYCLYYEFGVNKFLTAYLEDGDNADVDEILREYCGRTGQTVISEATKILDWFTNNKIKLDVFDECPEKEAPFEQLMGPLILDIQEERLTVELLDRLLNGEITPEELVAETMPSD